jgi:hypothetical protein
MGETTSITSQGGAMSEERYLSQSVDFLGFLRSQLSGLQGISTLCYELIQNADDVKDEQGNPGASRISFDVCDDALWVENDGVFRPIDFERMRRLAWGDKRNEENTTGTFGIGFISVYQITDSPELFSNGKHWIFRPTEEEKKRIEVEDIPTEFTRFRLPWAFQDSQIRKELGICPIDPTKLPQISSEICRAVEKASLFLKQIHVLEVKRSGQLIKRIETSREGNQVLLQDGDNVEVWTFFEGSFSEQAFRLRKKIGNDWIEGKRRPIVQIAFPDSSDLDGLLYAYLPSEMHTHLPFHINADFYPTPDRKRILFDDTHKGEWNRLAIECAIDILVQHISDIANLLPPEKFWGFLTRVHQASRNANLAPIFGQFWERAKPSVTETECVSVLNTTSQRLSPPKTIFLISETQVKAAQILSEIGLPVVDPRLKAYQNLLLECGARPLQIQHIEKAFEEKGLNQTLSLQQVPKSLQSLQGWNAFWDVLNELCEQQGQNKKLLSEIAIAFGSDGNLWPPSHLYGADEETQILFSQIDPKYVWFDARGYSGAIPSQLVRAFSTADAVNLLQDPSLKTKIQQLLANKTFPIKDIYAWLEKHKDEITPDLKQQLRNCPIWPTADGSLRPLNNLFLPGGFNDPLGLAQLVDIGALGGKREFLEATLGVQSLDFLTYVSEWVPSAIKSGELPVKKRVDLLILLAENLGKIQDYEQLQRALANLPLVWCGEDRFEKADQVYFESEPLRRVLGEAATTAQMPEDRREAVRRLYEWLGVAQEPRVRDLLRRIQDLVHQPPDKESIQQLQEVFDYIATQWEDWDELKQREFSRLKDFAWLPGNKEGNAWCKPNEVYSDYRKHLFESQGTFLVFARPVQQKARKFLEFLGVKHEPTPMQVVKHLLFLSQRGQATNKEVYQFLNQYADHVAIDCLKGKPCLYLEIGKYIRPQDAFWDGHPFGQFRFQLDSQWREYQKLLDRLGVKNKPDGDSAMEVLLEIAEEFGNSHKQLTGKDEAIENIVIQCWKILSDYLGNDQQGHLSGEIKKKLGKARTIPDNRHILTFPEHIYLEDCPDLAEKFSILKHNLIKLPSGAWRAMEAAGAQRMSKAVKTEINELENPTPCRKLTSNIRERLPLINRIIEIEVHKANKVSHINIDRLANLQVFRADTIRVTHTLSAFGRIEQLNEVVEALQIDGERLYFSLQNGQIPWNVIARELARILYAEGDLPSLALGLKEILLSTSLEEANRTLDQMGYPRIQETSYAPLDTKPVSPGGTVSHTEDIKPVIQEAKSPVRTYGLENLEKAPDEKARVESHSFKRSTRRLISYVGRDEKDSPDEEIRSETSRLNEIGRAGIQKVIEYEKTHGRRAVDKNVETTHHPGYDIESIDSNGETRFIEVKALSGLWDSSNPVRMTKSEYETAKGLKDKYWLYVVENLDSGNPTIYPIQDPTGKVDYYLFDHGWRGIAVDEEILVQ